MRSYIRVLAVAAMTLAAMPAAEAQTLPSASDVVAKYVNAIGGRDAILKIKSMTQRGTMEVPAAGVTADMETFAAAPNKSATKSTIAGLGEMLQGFDGEVGWDVNPMAGPRLLTDKELVQAKENSDFYGSRLFSPELYTSMSVLEETEFSGEKAYKVKMVRKSGNEQTHYFSVASGLLLGSEITQDSPMGTSTVTMKYLDYTDVDGIKISMKQELVSGPMTIMMTVKETVFNSVPDSAFAIPEQIKPLVKK